MKSSFLNDRTWDDLAGGGFSNKPKRGEKMGDALKATAIGAMTWNWPRTWILRDPSGKNQDGHANPYHNLWVGDALH